MNDVSGWLVVKQGPTTKEEYPLSEVETTIGRSQNNKIVLSDPEVSRRHARLWRQGEGYQLEDLGSTNGTFVNGRRISGIVPLYDGDELQLGAKVILQFRLESGYTRPFVITSAVAEEPEIPLRDQAPPTLTAAPPPGTPSGHLVVPQGAAPATRDPRRWLLGCGCLVLFLVFLCAATFFFLDAYQGGQLLYCGSMRPFFEIVLGPFAFAPVCP